MHKYTLASLFLICALSATPGWGQTILVNKTFSVPAYSTTTHTVTCSPGQVGHTIAGYYKIPNSDIVFFICDEANYLKWKSGGTPGYIRNLGKSGYGTFQFQIPAAGKFYFVMSNSYSPAGNKKIELRVIYTKYTSVDDIKLPLSRCYIATAAYGTPYACEVEILREFRDTRLVTNAPGRLLVNTYYALSPPLAALIARSPALRSVTRLFLRPAIAVAAHYTAPED